MKTVVPVETCTPTFRYEWTIDEQNQVKLCPQLDLATNEEKEQWFVQSYINKKLPNTSTDK